MKNLGSLLIFWMGLFWMSFNSQQKINCLKPEILYRMTFFISINFLKTPEKFKKFSEVTAKEDVQSCRYSP